MYVEDLYLINDEDRRQNVQDRATSSANQKGMPQLLELLSNILLLSMADNAMHYRTVYVNAASHDNLWEIVDFDVKFTSSRFAALCDVGANIMLRIRMHYRG